MPKWNDGLVDAFPIPLDHQLKNLSIKDTLALITAEPDEFSTSILSDPFPFFSLPAEIRNRIYSLVLFSTPSYRRGPIGIRPSRLSLLLTSKRFHLESSYALYTKHKFLIFPIQTFNALPTIQELPLHYRLLVTNLEIVVGSSWTSPPKSWRVTKSLSRCLAQLKAVRTLGVFIEFDPSHPAFRKYRVSYDFYTDFCGDLLSDVVECMPQVEYVQIDGNNGVDVHGPLVTRLREESILQEKSVRWGKQSDWAHKFDKSLLREYEVNEEVRNVEMTNSEDKKRVVVKKVGRSNKWTGASASTAAAAVTGSGGGSGGGGGQTSKPSRWTKKKKDDHMVSLY